MLAGGAIALSPVAPGDLNAVAELVTIFFLTLEMVDQLPAAVMVLNSGPPRGRLLK
jgi:hypothetical protein